MLLRKHRVIISTLLVTATAGAFWVTRNYGASTAAATNNVTDAWIDVSHQKMDSALAKFESQAQPHSREVSLGIAVTLLNTQPLTAANIDRAAALLETVRSENSDDATGIEATFMLARLEQFHRFAPSPERALELYSQLSASHP